MNKMLQRALLRREVIEVKLDDEEKYWLQWICPLDSSLGCVLYKCPWRSWLAPKWSTFGDLNLWAAIQLFGVWGLLFPRGASTVRSLGSNPAVWSLGVVVPFSGELPRQSRGPRKERERELHGLCTLTEPPCYFALSKDQMPKLNQ